MTIECNNTKCKHHCLNSGDPSDEGPFCYESECHFESLVPLANADMVGKSMLNRPLDQMPPAVQQAVEQVLTPQPQEDDQTTQAIAPEAQQPPQQQVEPTYPAQRTTLAAIQQQASAGPAYNAQGIDAMLPAKTPLQAAIERIRNEKAAEKQACSPTSRATG